MYSFIAYIFKHYMVSVFPCFKIFLEHVSLQKAVIYFLYDWTLRLLSFLFIFVMNFLILNLHTWLFPWKRFLGLESSQRVWVFSPLDCQQALSFLLRGISFFRLSSPFIYFIAADSSVFPCFQHQWLGWSALPLTTVTLEAAARLWCCVCTPWGAPITSTQPASSPLPGPSDLQEEPLSFVPAGATQFMVFSFLRRLWLISALFLLSCGPRLGYSWLPVWSLHPMTLWPTSVLQQTLRWGNCYSVPSLCLDPGSSPTASVLFSSVSPQKLLPPASPVPPTSLLCMEFCPLIYLKNILATPLGTWNLISSTTDSPLDGKHSVLTTGPPRKS